MFTKFYSDNRDTIRAGVRIFGACSLCAVAGIVASIFLVLAGVTLADNAKITDHLSRALDDGVLEDFEEVSPFGHGGLKYDMLTECNALGVNLAETDKGVLWRTAATPAPTVPRPGARSACDVLFPELRAGDVVTGIDYPRYWHGYQVVTRPLLSVLSLGQFRVLLFLTMAASLIYLCMQLASLWGPLVWPAVLIPFLYISDLMTAGILVTHGLPLAVGFATIAGFIQLNKRADHLAVWVIPTFLFACGMAMNFIGYLINPPIVPAFIGFAAVAMGAGRSVRESVRNLLFGLLLGLVWYGGYATEWIGKWVYASAILGHEAVLDSVLSRAGDYERWGEAEKYAVLDATKANYQVAGGHLKFGALALLCAVWMSVLFVRRNVTVQSLVDYCAMLFPLLGIIVWIELTTSISVIHAEFVARNLMLFYCLPIIAFLVISANARRRGPVTQ